MWRDAALLVDMLDAALDARELTLDGREALDDLRHERAVLHTLQIIGEAASHTSAECRAERPDLPWAGIIGLRNRIVHGYGDVDHDIIWDVLERDVPRLIAGLEDIDTR